MAQAWKNWEGQIVDRRFPLRQLLGESNHSAVFLTEREERGGEKAAIKLVVANGNAAEQQLQRWRQAARLAHPNLLPLYQYGRCCLGDLELLFAVMQVADESLADILPQRALSVEETRQMLGPVLEALMSLHQQGLVHGDVQPANILAVGETIKLSSDTIRAIDEGGAATVQAGALGAEARPAARGSVEPAGDIYSLGITIVQALTQRSPFDAGSSLGHSAPALAAPFDDIVPHALHPDPQLRWTAADIAARLNPAAAPATAGVSAGVIGNTMAAGVGVGESHVAAAKSEKPPERPAAKAVASSATHLPVATGSPAAVPLSPVAPLPPQARGSAGPASSLLRYAAPIAVAVILLLMASKVFHRGGNSAADSTVVKSTAPQKAAEIKAPAAVAAAPRSERPTPKEPSAVSAPALSADVPARGTGDVKSPLQNSRADATVATKSAEPKEKKLAETLADSSRQPEASPAAMKSAVRATPAASTASGSPDVLEQVLPDVSQKSLATIRGTVRMTIRASVDSQGKVADAQFESPSGSPFFNDLALKAARRWQFQPSTRSGDGTQRNYLLHFEITQAGSKASVTAAP